MKPREIEVHIEELVLHGFPGESRYDIGDALQSELRTLLAEQGIPATWNLNPERIDARAIDVSVQSKPVSSGEKIARAVHGGGAS
jgi:hypothetical protein